MRVRRSWWTLPSWRRPSPVAVRRAFLGALVMNTVIVVTGGAVRLTASGLGCPTVPKCTADSMVPTPEMGIHGAIEFGNRLLTFVLSAAALAALVAAWRAGRRDLLGLAWLLVLGIAVQALLGAVTVLTGLNPVTVMVHFLVSMVLIALAVVAHERAGREPGDVRPQGRGDLRALSLLLATAVAATLVVGTVVTGTGPHSGDEDATDRLPFDLESVSQLHADLVFLVLGLTIGLVFAARVAAHHLLHRRALVLLAIVVGQGVVGFVQYATDLPVLLVGLHMFGATLVWIGSVRAVLAVRSPARGAGGDLSAPRSSDGSRRAPASAAAR